MKTKPRCQSGYINPRLLFAVGLCSLGVVLAALSFGGNPPTNNNVPQSLNSITCVSASDCWAVGNYRNYVSGADRTLIEHWNGTGWSIMTSPNTSDTQSNYLNGVTCASSSQCWVVGYYNSGAGNSPPYETLIEHWDGTTWSIVTSPNVSNSGVLNGVTCTSTSQCWAVGYYQNVYFHTLTLQWNGTAWSVVTSPNTGSTDEDLLQSVTCPSPSACWAVGRYSNGNGGFNQTLIQQWNGTGWSIVTSPNASSHGEVLNGVTCTSTSQCWTVGSYYDANFATQTLIEHWNGTAWSIVSAPNPGSFLNSVTCSSASQCWAVGSYPTVINGYGVQQTVIEQWNGTSWSVINSSNASSKDNILNAVACASASACLAVGSYTTVINTYDVQQTVIEQWDGTGWPIVTHPPATLYTITDLGTLGGLESFAYGINATGQITGSVRLPDNSVRAFLYSGGTMTVLGTPGGNSVGYSINDSGQVTGYYSLTGSTIHAFLYSGGTVTDLGTMGGNDSGGYGINNSGQITGYSQLADGSAHAFFWSAGTMTDLGTLGGTNSVGYAINDSGQVAGKADLTPGSYGNASNHAFRYSGGTMTDIGRLVSDDYNSESYAINDLGTAVGRAELSYGDLAFVYNSDTSYGIIGTLGLNYSEALGVNKVGFGQMVGDFVTFDSHTHAWLWTEAGHLVDLNTLVPSDSGWTVISATAINDAGQIVGHGLNPDGNNDAFLLSFVNSSPSPTPQLTPTPTASPTATTTATATVPPSPTPPPANISGTVTYCPNPALNPVPGVTMTLTGTSGRSTITNGLGNYAFLGLPTGGNYTVTPTRPALPPGFPGITTVDVIAIQRHYLGSALLTGCRLSGADCAPPFGVVNTADMIAVQRFFLGLTTGIGNAGIFQFNPVNRSYSALNSNQTGQNYTALVLGDVSSPYVY